MPNQDSGPLSKALRYWLNKGGNQDEAQVSRNKNVPDFSNLNLPSGLNSADLGMISDQLGPSAYGTITKARAGYAPTMGLDSGQLAQADRYMEGSAYRDSGAFDKALKLGLGMNYEAAKGLAQNIPGGRGMWNSTIGQFSDFAMDDTTSPASLNNVLAYSHGMFSPQPEDDGIRYASGRR